ncbi:MAG: sensor domain-containing diguanylate cyclase [Pseudomonadota bacterium]
MVSKQHKNRTIKQALFDSILDGIIVIDQKGTICDINQSTNLLFDYDDGELVGKDFSTLLDCEDPLMSEALLFNASTMTQSSKDYERLEVVAKKKTDELFYVVLSSAQFEDDGEALFLVTVKDISNQVEELLSAEFQALYDDLTGLASRRLLEQKIETAISKAIRNEQVFHVLFIDLDNFKPINDELGHDVGDDVLIMFAKRLSNCFRTDDVCARIGGDEFVVLCEPSPTGGDGRLLIDKVKSVLIEPMHHRDTQLKLDASIGISTFPDNGGSVSELIRYADSQMYEMKRGFKHERR